MLARPLRAVLGLVVLTSCLALQIGCRPSGGPSALPPALKDDEFWRLSTELSEPEGVFTHSDNLVSNESHFPHTIRRLRARGGAYIGVGPEQNFSYMARLEPSIAFIIDIRSENRNLHLLYKALFELSADRADFVSRLFSRERPDGLGPSTSVQDLFAQYETVKPSRQLYEASARLIRERLLDTHRFPLSSDDLQWIDYALEAHYSDGPDIHYGRTLRIDAPGPSYRTLMTATDLDGESRSYLASEEGFAVVKALQARNLIVPVVGDFGGTHAIQRAGDYIRQRNETLEAFYGSNVEGYLSRAKLPVFCRNLATLPYGSRSWYIGSKGMQSFGSKLRSCKARGR
jgi:hypothetical protein